MIHVTMSPQRLHVPQCPSNAVMRVLPDDLGGADHNARALSALRRFRVVDVRDAASPEREFERAYATLASEFAASGELEPRHDLQWELYKRTDPPGWHVRYHLLNFYDGERLAGVRDTYVMVHPARRVCIVLLAHALVLPEWRRTGLGALIRAVPAALGREALARHRIPDGQLLIFLEMEPVDPRDERTVVRMLAYGRAGYRVLPPDQVPYAQPDFSDWRSAGGAPRPIPLVLLVRHVGHELLSSMPLPLVRAVYDAIDLLHMPATPEDTLARQDMLNAALARRKPGDDRVPLLPCDTPVPELFRPLLRERVLPLIPRRLGGLEGERPDTLASELGLYELCARLGGATSLPSMA